MSGLLALDQINRSFTSKFVHWCRHHHEPRMQVCSIIVLPAGGVDVVSLKRSHSPLQFPCSSRAALLLFFQAGRSADDNAVSGPLHSTCIEIHQFVSHEIWVWATYIRSICYERADLIALAVLGCCVKSLLCIRQRPA